MPTDVELPESILFVITRGDSIGGGQIHVRDLARRLQNEDVRVAVVAGSSGALQAQLDATGIPHFLAPSLKRSVNPFSDLVAIVETMRLIRRFRPALVSAHTAKAGMVGRLAAFFCGVPVVFTAHGWQFAEGIAGWQKALVLTLETILARMASRIITVSGYDLDLALRAGLGSKHKIVLVHNGMPWRRRKDVDVGRPSPVRLIMTARFQPQKDHETLFAALKLLKAGSWILELVGDGPLLDAARISVKRSGWENSVTFAGQVADVPERLETADIFVLASLWEGFPRSILEAMRAGLPVVASGVGGVREAVEDGVTGYVVPPQDPESLAAALQKLIDDPQSRVILGEAGRRRYETEFTFDAMFAKTQRVWRAAIARP